MEHKKSNQAPLTTDLTPSTDVEAGHTSIIEENPAPLKKHFSAISLAGIGLTTGNVWPAVGGSLLTSIANGGPPGVLYEFILASIFYFAIASVIAELASALPSSSGPLFWATVTAGKRHGRVVGYFAGWWNTLAWIFGQASMCSIAGNLCVQIYAVMNPSFTPKAWHIFVCYLLITWLACAIVCLANPIIPRLNIIGLVLILAGVLITVVVCISMTGKRAEYASSETVWVKWTADIGYPDGFVFIAGILNGAFAMGTPDATSHLAEEIPHPEVNVPRAIAWQYVIGFVSGLGYLIAILYCISDYDTLAAAAFPIAEAYKQATNSDIGTVGLLVVLLLPVLICNISLSVTSGRTLWTLARIRGTPMSKYLGQINKKNHMPLNATLAAGLAVTILGCIELGSSTAFNAFISSFILNSTASYMAAMIPYLARRHRSGFAPGPFRMRGVWGWIVHASACAYMLVWFVVYCFPFSLPTNAYGMNYSSLTWGGLTIFVSLWWFAGARRDCLQVS